MTRREHLMESGQDLPRYRTRQMFEALFQPNFRSLNEVSVLPQTLREHFRAWPWMTVTEKVRLESKRHDTFKAILSLADGKRIETVLMQNARGHYSVCVSSQVGCAMACTFCATGKMGFGRQLTEDEIVDQYRYWMYFLNERETSSQGEKRHFSSNHITNIVFMGMGEPLANYDAVKHSMQTILEFTEIGPTRITVSTVGLLPGLRRLLKDPDWPPVRLAVSLHSADPKTRSVIMPSSGPQFLDDLAEWTRAYFTQFSSRRRHLTFEYVMLAGVNDSEGHAKKLIAFTRRVGKVKINLIPYNDTKSKYASSESAALVNFENLLRRAHIDVTRRRTMGADIAAACGQLIVEKSDHGI